MQSLFLQQKKEKRKYSLGQGGNFKLPFILSAVDFHWHNLSKAFTPSLQRKRQFWLVRGRKAVSIARSGMAQMNSKNLEVAPIFLLITKPTFPMMRADEQGGKGGSSLFLSWCNANIPRPDKGHTDGQSELWGPNVPYSQSVAGLQILTASSCLFIQ